MKNLSLLINLITIKKKKTKNSFVNMQTLFFFIETFWNILSSNYWIDKCYWLDTTDRWLQCLPVTLREDGSCKTTPPPISQLVLGDFWVIEIRLLCVCVRVWERGWNGYDLIAKGVGEKETVQDVLIFSQVDGFSRFWRLDSGVKIWQLPTSASSWSSVSKQGRNALHC